MATVLLLTSSIGFSQQVQKVSPAGTQYFLYTPPAYSAGDGPYPLLVFLHGLGGMGDDLDLLLTHKDQIPAKFIAQGTWPYDQFIVVTPQLRRDESVTDVREQVWPPEMVDEVVRKVQADYAVNSSKIYVTGLSMGAHGSYSYAAAYPSKVAAAVIVSGAPDSTIACQVKDVPLWAFHGSDDRQVWPVFTAGVIRELNACSPAGKFRPRLNMLYARRHEGWDEIYNNTSSYNIYDWMLKFTKNNPANTPPYVNAGLDFTIAHSDKPIHLFGEFFDSDGTIANVFWRKVNGPAVNLDDTDKRFLKLSNFATGTYEFELTVTDNAGAQKSDRVSVNIVSGGAGMSVTGLTLMDASNEQDIAALRDGYVLNPQTVTNEINIRATATGSPQSVRFKVNGNHNARTADPPFLLADLRWTIEEGEYLVCATPYSGRKGTGTAGVTQCFKIIVSSQAVEEPEEPVDPEEPEEPVDPEEPEEPVDPEDPEEPVDPEEPEEPVDPEEPEEPVDPEEPEEPVDPEEPELPVSHFYARAEADLSQLSGWSSNPEGTGVSPGSFSTDGQIFDVTGKVELNNPLAIGGTGTLFRIRTGGELVLNSGLTAEIDMEPQSVLHVNTNHPVTPGTLHPSSVTHFNTNALVIPAADYGHLNFHGPGSAKTLAPGTTRIAGNFTVDDAVGVEGAADPGSVLVLSGNMNIAATENFVPAVPFSMVFNKGSAQNFSLGAARAAFQMISVGSNTTVELTGSENNTILQLGSDTGGGLSVASGGTFNVKRNDLIITGQGTLNPENQSGAVGFSQSSLQVISASPTNSNLYALAGRDSLRNLIVNLTGTGNLVLRSPLYVVDHVNVMQGEVNSNGFLSLVSTASHTGRIGKSEGNGFVSGDVIFQRFIGRGKQVRYLGFPVSGATVQELQSFIPVTGDFNGASVVDGMGNSPSLHFFDETRGGWIAYPEGDNTATLVTGRGYSVSTLDEARDTKIILTGPLQRGDFTYALTPNPANDPDRGWNLIGNPYASPVQWDAGGWIRKGSGTAAYVLDDRYPGGRFLVWDGETGDAEFEGIISQGQAFFIRTTAAAPVLTLTEEAKVDTSSNLWRGHKTETYGDHLIVTMKQNDLTDRTYLKFSDAGENHFDESDAVKRRNGYFSLSSLSSDSVSLAINHSRESRCDRSIALAVDSGTPGRYTLAFEGSLFSYEAVEIILIDHFTASVTPLAAGSAYTFDITADPASFGSKRFAIAIPSGTIEGPAISVAENILTSNITSGNQWLLDGEEIEGATSQTYVPEVTGEYTLRTTTDGCSEVSEPVFITVTVTGIHENKNGEVIFYPNPASDFIHIRLQTPEPGKVYYTITNTLGMQVAQGEAENEKMINGSEIDVRALPSGVYFLNLRTSGWRFQTKFIVDPTGP